MRFHLIHPARAAACNDNGAVALARPATAARDALAAARLICGPVSLLYVAQGSLLMSAASQRQRQASAA